MCGQHNVRASVGDSTGQNTDKGHSPNPRVGIKISDPAGNVTRARRVGRQGFYRPRHGYGYKKIYIYAILQYFIKVAEDNRNRRQ